MIGWVQNNRRFRQAHRRRLHRMGGERCYQQRRRNHDTAPGEEESKFLDSAADPFLDGLFAGAEGVAHFLETFAVKKPQDESMPILLAQIRHG